MAFDTITPSNLVRGTISSVINTLFTVLVLTRVIIKNIDISNNNLGASLVTLHLVPFGGIADSSNILIPGVYIKGGTIFQWTGAQVLEEGDTIQAVSDSLDVSVNISGAVCS